MAAQTRGLALRAVNVITNYDAQFNNQTTRSSLAVFPADSTCLCAWKQAMWNPDMCLGREEWHMNGGRGETPLTPQVYHAPMGSSYSAILYCPRTGSTWYAILLQSKCQMYWLIWGHGTTGTAAVAHSACNRLLHWLFNKELLALLHKQAELWPRTLSSSSMNLNEGGAILNGGQLKALLGVSNVMIHHPPHLQQSSNTRFHKRGTAHWWDIRWRRRATVTSGVILELTVHDVTLSPLSQGNTFG